MNTGFGRYSAMGLLLVLTTVGLTSGCATRRYVKNQVSSSSNDLSAKMNQKDTELENGISGNSNQINELSGVTREHSQQIGSLDSGLKATEGKATQAMNVGEAAQGTATQAMTHVNTLDEEFQARNHFTTLSEESVPFKFDSAKVDKEHTAMLDQIAQRLKQEPDSILVLEGRTDSVGDQNYNIQLGEKRLDAVIRYLVVEQGVPMHQIYKMSFGAAKPVAENKTREGRAQNRAVIVRLMGPETGSGAKTVSDASTVTR